MQSYLFENIGREDYASLWVDLQVLPINKAKSRFILNSRHFPIIILI